MSYANDVALAVKTEDFFDFIKKNAADEETFNAITDTLADAEKIYKTIDYLKGVKPVDVVILYWRFYKGWYRDTAGVIEIKNWYKKLDDYEFVRVGEETGDVEERHHHKNDNEAWYIVDTFQGIVIDGDEKL